MAVSSIDEVRKDMPRLCVEIYNDIATGELDQVKTSYKMITALKGLSSIMKDPNLNQYMEPAAAQPAPKAKTIHDMSYADYMVRKRVVLAYEQEILPKTGKPIHVPLGKIHVDPPPT